MIASVTATANSLALFFTPIIAQAEAETSDGPWSLFDVLKGQQFDPFFRGLLSVLVGVVVLIGGTYLIVATNTGIRTGFMISGAGLFGWMFLMGIIWTTYGIGWVGAEPTWHMIELNVDDPDETGDGLIFSEHEKVQEMADIKIEIDDGIDDPDLAQDAALVRSRELELGEWRYLIASDSARGDAQATAVQTIVEEEIFAAGEFVPLQFGGFTAGGKPVLKENANIFDRFVHFFDETFAHPTHPQELMIVQVQSSIDRPALPGEAPPPAEIDEDSALVSIVLERDRGGPFPSIISGLRFTPLMFTIFNALIFGLFCYLLHIRDKRMAKIRSATA